MLVGLTGSAVAGATPTYVNAAGPFTRPPNVQNSSTERNLLVLGRMTGGRFKMVQTGPIGNPKSGMYTDVELTQTKPTPGHPWAVGKGFQMMVYPNTTLAQIGQQLTKQGFGKVTKTGVNAKGQPYIKVNMNKK
jgi:hypothetical protein